MAAAVFIPPSPHDSFSNMATSMRRAPLASITNATNSPHRLLTTSGSKRSRAATGISQQENEPPHKRQALDRDREDNKPLTPRRRPQPTSAEGKVFERGNGESGTTAFQRRLVAARDKNASSKGVKEVERDPRDIDSMRQWQKHYRKLFPTFIFFFDSVSEDARIRFVRQIRHLGAREAKFFDNSVTHIVTTRSVPPSNKDADNIASHNNLAIDEQNPTINPSLLEKPSGLRSLGTHGCQVRREGPHSSDILVRGRQMDMKIWAAEKLHRVLALLIEEVGPQIKESRALNISHRAQEDLSQVLRNEKIGATAEREQVSMPRELVSFRGPFIYVHDMDEKTRPIMVREYTKVSRRQDGEWPQFRSATVGKCPFVEDPAIRREMDQERNKQKSVLLQQQKGLEKTTRTQSVIDLATAKTMNPPRRTSPRKALQTIRNPTIPTAPQMSMGKPPCKPERQSSFPPMPEQPPCEFVKPSQMQYGREPAASGIQRSNMTSAIQSQMISSTAVTGLKAGTSKEVNELKRKVLEKTHTGSLSIGSIPSSHRTTDTQGALRAARPSAPQRAAKSRAQEKLGGIQEEDNAYADETTTDKAGNALSKKKQTKRDPKPGYCENCRDKYDDFDEHVISRKHRKFAMTQSNWEDLDALLAILQ